MRFTIRDLLWLMALVATTLALGGGWLNAEREHANSHFWQGAATSLAGELERLGYDVELVENRKLEIRHNRWPETLDVSSQRQAVK